MSSGVREDAVTSTVTDDRAPTRDTVRSLVVKAAFTSPPATRGEIAMRTGVSIPSVSRAVKDLLAEGLLEEGPVVARRGAGRRSQGLLPARALGCVIGVDFGPAMTRAVCRDMAGRILTTWEGETPESGEAEAHVRWIGSVVPQMLGSGLMDLPVRHLVLSFPSRVTERRAGLFDVRDGARPQPQPIMVADELTRRFGFPVTFENESVAALVAELDAMPEPRPYCAVLISVSQRVTAAIALGGVIMRGERQAAGMIGGLPFGASGEPVSTALTMPAIARELDRIGLAMTGWNELISGDSSSERIDRIRERFIAGLTLVTAAVAGSVDPDVVIYDGRVLPLVHQVLDDVRTRLDGVLPVVPELRLSRDSSLFSSANGAALLALDAAKRSLLDAVVGAPGGQVRVLSKPNAPEVPDLPGPDTDR